MSDPTATVEKPAPDTAPPAVQSLPAARPAGAVGPVRMGLAPSSFEEGYRMAQVMSQSGLVPKNFQGKPADVLVAIEMGVELGLPPMQALQSIAVINGRPSVWGDGFLALIMASPSYADHDEYYEVDGKRADGLTVDDLKKDTTAAVCTFIRHRKQTAVTRRFTVAQAKKASLWAKPGPWQEYPDRMLSMRARSFAGRDAFPDVLRGICTAEEAMDSPAEVIEIPAKEPQRLSVAPAAAPDPPAAAMNAPEAREVPVSFTGKVVGMKQGEDGMWDVKVSTGATSWKHVEVARMPDAVELEKFLGTDHEVKFHCANVGESSLELLSFEIAD